MRVFLFILLGLGMAWFIWFLLTIRGKEWLSHYIIRLGTNNNTRAGFCWIITGALFILYLLVCAKETQWPMGIDISTPHYSEEIQKWLTLYNQKMAEPATIGDTVGGVWAVVCKVFLAVCETACSLLGYFVLCLSIVSPIYTVIAFRDEFMSAWAETKDKMFGPKGDEQDLLDMKLQTPPTSPVQAQPQSGSTTPINSARKPLSVSNYLTYEFIFALIGELSNMFIHRRRF